MGRPSKIHEHRGKWRTRIDGHEHDLGTDKRQAQAEFHRLMASKLRDEPTGRPSTVAGAVDAWLALHDAKNYRQWLAAFFEHCGREYLADVGRDLLTRYHVHLKGQRAKAVSFDKVTRVRSIKETDKALSAGTIKQYIKAATAVLKWAQSQGWMATTPDVPKCSAAPNQPRDIEPARLVEVLDDLPERAGRPLRFIAFTGCRPSEACKLEWSHVHLDAGLCILPVHKTGTKTGKPRTIFLTQEAASILKSMLPDIGEPTGYVFTSSLGTPYTPAVLRSILKYHGGFCTYALRHSFAQAALGQLPIEDVGRLLGHADLRMVQLYAQVRDTRAVAAAKSLRPIMKTG